MVNTIDGGLKTMPENAMYINLNGIIAQASVVAEDAYF